MKLSTTSTVVGGQWVGGGLTKTKSMLTSTQVEVVVEVGVELGNIKVPIFCILHTVGTVPMLSILYEGTVPLFCILNVGAVPRFRQFQIKLPC